MVLRDLVERLDETSTALQTDYEWLAEPRLPGHLRHQIRDDIADAQDVIDKAADFVAALRAAEIEEAAK
jgi:hypothetical protein